MTKEKTYHELLAEWLEQSPLNKEKAVTFHYKDGSTYTMNLKEWAVTVKDWLVQGMLGDHRPIIKKQVLMIEE